MLDQRIAAATRALLALQQPDGHWVFELEADATIPAEYVLLRHYLAEPVDAALEAKIAVYLRRIQGEHGGWPLFHDGAFDMSASVKAYFALKMIGDPIDAPHMARAREAIRARGGAARSNVFTRCLLALFGVISWRAVPVMPVEIMLLPKWFPFHLDKISYWSRTVIVPLLVLQALQAAGAQSQGRRASTSCSSSRRRRSGPRPRRRTRRRLVLVLPRASTRVLRAAEPLFPKRARQRAIDRAVAWSTERLNGEDGLGAIFPAMANSVMMFDVLGYPADHPQRAIARKSIEKLLVVHEDEAYCQPCVSPVWDTGLACHALLEVGGERAVAQARKRPRLAGADADPRRQRRLDRAAAGRAAGRLGVPVRQSALSRRRRHRGGRRWRWTARKARAASSDFRAPIARAREWIVGMQSDERRLGRVRRRQQVLLSQQHPVRRSRRAARSADRGRDRALRLHAGAARRDAQTARRCARAVDYLRRTQLADGSWYGRWGMNYIYGTWSVLCALNAAGVAHDAPEIRKAVDWLARIQNADGGWGEDGASYKLDYRGYEAAPSTASQTAWALLGLMAAGEVDHPAVARGDRLSRCARRAPTASGTRRATPRPASRACSICATTAIRNSSRCGRWRATAT